ncbi:hypothetical protein ABK040_013354 [Willaertia magna]
MSAHWKLLKEKLLPPTETINKTVFTILMVNDVYEMVADDAGVGGLAELATMIELEKVKARNCIATLNGDFMSASSLAAKYLGGHMVDIMNHIQLDYVVPGNHEFDFGTPNVIEKIKQSKFKWICSNIVHSEDENKVLEGCLRKVTLECDGFKIGLFGVCTKATESLSRPGKEVIIKPSILVAREMVKELREIDKCDVIIALTHLTIAEDRELARQCKGIDVILGGHDHTCHTQMQGSCFIHKAGHDAQWLTRIDLMIEKKSTKIPGSETLVQTKVFPSCNMIVNRGYKPNEQVAKVIKSYMDQLPEGALEQIGITTTKLDSSTESVRSKETSFANFVCDVIKEIYSSEIAIMNGGGIRGDRLYECNKRLKRIDFMKEFPFVNSLVLTEMKGSALLKMAEYGVSKAECVVGSFLHYSKGICLEYDSTLQPNHRIIKMSLNGEPIDKDRLYKVASVGYIVVQGGDGFEKDLGKIIEHPMNDKSVYDTIVGYVERNYKVGAEKEGRVFDRSKVNSTLLLNF